MSTTPAGSGRPASPGAGRRRSAVRRTRTGGWWVALVAAALVLLLLLIFMLQNGQRVRVSFLGAAGSLPLGVALLLAAIAGVLIVAVPGTGRIIQLRRIARRPVKPGPSDLPARSAEGTTATRADTAPGASLPGSTPGVIGGGQPAQAVGHGSGAGDDHAYVVGIAGGTPQDRPRVI